MSAHVERLLTACRPEFRRLARQMLENHLLAEDGWRRTGQDAQVWAYRSYEETVCALGHGPVGAPLRLPERLHPMPLGQCYLNAYTLAASDSSLTYTEGFALAEPHRGFSGAALSAHAWVTDPDNTVIDPTWASGDMPPGHTVAYLGVPFATEFVSERGVETGRCSIFGTDDLLLGHRALRHGFVTNRGIVVGYANSDNKTDDP